MTSEPIEEGNNLVTYYQKGLDLHSLRKYEEAISYFNIAIEISPNDANFHYNKGLALQDLGKNKEAVLCYNKAVEINPNHRESHSQKVLVLLKLGRGQEAVDYYDQAIEIDPENIIFYEYKALALQRMGLDQAAGDCLRKLEEIKGSKHKFHFSEGLTLKSQKKYQEAVLAFDKALEMNERSTYAHFYKGLTLLSLDKNEDAVLCFDRTIETTFTPKNPLYYCVRGRTLISLNRQQDALADFKKAQEIGKSGEKVFLMSPSGIEHLTIIVNSILELQKEHEKAERMLGQLEKKKFVEDLNVLKSKKEKLTTDLLAKIEEKYSLKIPQEKINAAWKLKESYQGLLKEIKEELSKEVDDFYKKSGVQVGDLDIGLERRVEEYSRAFIGTFRLVFEGSQAIENEKYQLDIGCLLSTFASFAPFVGDLSGITSIGNFFSRNEIQTNAKKMLELFFDSSEYLNAMVSKTAEKIVGDTTKREKILFVTEKELHHQNRILLQKISKFCEQMSEPIDIGLYKQLYKTPAARIGHIDANYLIQEYCEGRISIDRVQEEFVEKTLERQRVETEEIMININEKKDSGKGKGKGKGKCCNIF